MVTLIQTIYDTLNEITSNVFFNMLPAGIDTSELFIIYELSETGSKNTLQTKNYANDIELTIKILHKDALTLIQTGQEVKKKLLNIESITYNSSVPIFQDPDLNLDQLTLNFELANFSDVRGVQKVRELNSYSIPELLAGLSETQILGLTDTSVELILNLMYNKGAELEQTLIISENEAGNYSDHTLQNIETCTYTVSDEIKEFPFELNAGDNLKITIVPTDPEQDSKIILGGVA